MMLRRLWARWVLVFGLTAPLMAEPDTVSWLVLDVPPSVILEGPAKGQGNLDFIREAFIRALPEFDHKLEINNIERVSKELQGTRNVIAPGLLATPERAKQFILSIPEAVIPSNMLIVRKAQRASFDRFLDANGEVDLDLLLASPLRVGVAVGRRYSGTADDSLSRHKDSPTLVVRAANDVSEGLVKMLLTDRLDASLLFPFEAQFVARQMGGGSDLLSLPIRGVPRYSVTVAAAPRTPWGEAMISRLNTIIRAQRQTSFLDALSPWLDEGANRLYRQRALEYFAANP